MNRLLKKIYKKLPKGAWYLDLGAGSGKDGLAMSEFGFVSLGIDLKTGHDIRDYDIKKNKFSIVSAFYSLHYMSKSDAISVINKVKDNLKPGGYFLYDDFNGFSMDELADLFHGFEKILLEEKIILDSHKGKRLPHFHKCVRLIARK